MRVPAILNLAGLASAILEPFVDASLGFAFIFGPEVIAFGEWLSRDRKARGAK